MTRQSAGRTTGLVSGQGVVLGGAIVLTLCMPAYAGPEGEQVVNGDAEFYRDGAYTEIHASHNAIINYSGFDIAGNETVRFVQPGEWARVLNRINSADPTMIAGTLLANGNVYFANPAGVIFGAGAVVDVGGIYAAAGNISNYNFLAGVDKFTGVSGSVVNEGTIQAAQVNLIGQYVGNRGTIVAPRGMVTMVSGEDVVLAETNGHMSVRIAGAAGMTAPQGAAAVENTGVIRAGGGRTILAAGDVYSLAIHNTGKITAKDLTVEGHGSGEVRIDGVLNAGDHRAHRSGGVARVTGELVNIQGTIIADGPMGGGTILVGGDFRGAGTMRTARRTYVARDAVLTADALFDGDGGRAVVWADEIAAFLGTASARGGHTGDGGMIEISGKDSLIYRGTADVSAWHGAFGTVLLDPTNITIADGAGGADDAQLSDNEILSGDGPGATYVISEQALEALAATANVVLEATNDITINDLSDNTLNFAATTGSVTITADSDASGGGAVTMVGAATDTLRTQGGDLTISGATVTLGAINTSGGAGVDGGNVTLSGDAVSIAGAITTTGGASVAGNGGDGGDVTVLATAGAVSLTSISAGGGSGGGALNTSGDGGTITLGATGNVTLTGSIVATGANATNNANGGSGGDITLTSTGGTITVNTSASAAGGTGNGTGSGGSGGSIMLDGAVSLAAAAANVSLVTAGAGGGSGDVTLTGAVDGAKTLVVTAGTGNVDFQGAIGSSTALTGLNVGSSLTADFDSTINTGTSGITVVNSGGGASTSFDGAITTTGSMTLTSPGTITFNSGATTSVANDITQSGGGTVSIAANITNTVSGHTVTFGDDVTLVGDRTFTTASQNALVFGGNLDIGTGDLTFTAGDVNFTGGANSVTGSAGSSITFRTVAAGGSIVVGGAADSGATVLDITDTDLAAIASSVDDLIIGRSDQTGAITVQSSAFKTDTLIRTSGAGSTTISGAVTLSGATSALTVRGTTTLASSITLSGGGVTFENALTVGGNSTITTGGGNVSFDSTINGGFSLAVNAGAGDIDIGDVGQTTAVGALSLTTTGAGQVRLAGDIQTDNANGNNANVTVSTGTAGTLLTTDIVIDTDSGGVAGGGGDVNFINTEIIATGGRTLSIDAESGGVDLGDVGTTDALGALSVMTSGTMTISGDIETDDYSGAETGDITFGGGGTTLLLNGNDYMFTSDAANDGSGGTMDFSGTDISATSVGDESLLLFANDGDVVLGDVGTGGGLGGFTVDTMGTTTMTGDIETDNDFGGDAHVLVTGGNVVLDEDVTITSNDGHIDLSAVTIDANADFSTLTISGGAGDVELDAIGQTSDLGALSVSTTGTIMLGGDITTDSNAGADTGNITITGNAVLAGLTTMTTDGQSDAGAGTITISDTLDVGTTDLTMTAAEMNFSGGDSSIFGTTGSSVLLRTTTAGGTVVVGDVLDSGAAILDVTSVDIDAIASTIDQFTIGRTDQTGTITVANSPTFKAKTLIRSADIVLGNATTQTIRGNASGIALTFEGDVSVVFDTVINTTAAAGSMVFDGNIDGPSDLDLLAGGGNITITGEVGQTTALGEFMAITSGSGVIIITGDISTDNSLGGNANVTIATGSGGWILAQDTTIDTDATDNGAAGDVDLSGAVVGAANGEILTITAKGGDVFLGDVGTLTGGELGGLTVSTTGTGEIALDGSIETDDWGGAETGDITFTTVSGSTTLATGATATINSDGRGDGSGGTIDLTGTDVDGDSAGNEMLTIRAGDGTIMLADVGQNTALGALIVNTSGVVELSGDLQTDDAGAGSGLMQFLGVGTAVLTGDTSMVTNGGDLDAANMTIDANGGGETLTINTGSGDAMLGAIGTGDALGEVNVTSTGIIALAGDIYADDNGALETGDVNLNGVVEIAGDTIINVDAAADGGSGTINFASTIDLTNNSLTLRALEIDFTAGANSITGATGSRLGLEAALDTQDIVIGSGADSGATVLDITTTDLAAIASSVDQLVIGNATGMHTITINTSTFQTNTHIRTPSGGGITLDNDITALGDGTAIHFEGDVTLTSNINIDSSANDGGIAFTGGDVDGAFNLVLDSGGGDIELASVGQSTPLSLLDLTCAGTLILGGDITATNLAFGGVTGDVDLDSDVALTATDNDLDLSNATGVDGAFNLDISVGDADISVASMGFATALTGVTLTTTGSGNVNLSGSIRTDSRGIMGVGDVVIATGGSTILTGNASIFTDALGSGTSGDIDLSGTVVDASAAGVQTFAMDAGDADITIGDVGQTTALGGFSLSTSGNASLNGDISVDDGSGPGTIVFGGGAMIDVVGGTIFITTDADGDGAGGDITTANATLAGAGDTYSFDAGDGDITIGDAGASGMELTQITMDSDSGLLAYTGDLFVDTLELISVSGTFGMGGNLTLDTLDTDMFTGTLSVIGDASITSLVGALDFSFASGIDSSSGNQFSLTLDTSAAGTDITLPSIGQTDALSSFTVDAGAGDVNLTGSIQTEGAVIIAAANMNISTDIVIDTDEDDDGAGGDVDLSGTTVTGGNGLRITAGDGAVSVGDAGASGTELTALTVESSGDFVLSGDIFADSFEFAALTGSLIADAASVSLTSTDTDIDLSGVAGIGSSTGMTNDLLIDAGAGDISLGGSGTGDALGVLNLDSTGELNLAGDLVVGTFDIADFSGKINILDDSSITTSDTAIDFTTTAGIDGSGAAEEPDFLVNTGTGDLTMGSVTSIGLLTLTTSGTLTITDIVSALDTDFSAVTGAVEIAANTTIEASEGGIDFGNATGIDSATNANLSLMAGDGGIALGPVGQTNALGILGLTTSGDVTFAGDIDVGSITASGIEGAILLGGDMTMTASSGGIDFSGATGIDGDGIGTYALSLIATGGDVLLPIAGAMNALASIDIMGDSITLAGATTIGDQTYTAGVMHSISGDYETLGGGDVHFIGEVELTDATTITAAGGDVLFDDAIEGDGDADEEDLTITTTGGGAVTLAGGAGGTIALGALTIDNDGLLTLGSGSTESFGLRGAFAQTGDGAVSLGANLATDDEDISFASAVTLIADSLLSSGTGDGNVSFDSTVDGGFLLTVAGGNGDVTFTGAVGGTTALSGLAVSSSNALRLLDGVTARGEDIDLNSTGLVDINGTVTTTNSGTFTVTNGGVFRVDQTYNLAGAFVQDGTGTVLLDIDFILAGRDVTFMGPMTLGLDAVIQGANVTLGNVDSDGTARSLVVNSIGESTFNGWIGSVNPLSSLMTDGAGTTVMDAARILTLGNQLYRDAMVVEDDSVLQSAAGSLLFLSDIDGGSLTAGVLTLLVGPSEGANPGVIPLIEFRGGVGSTTALEGLAIGTGTDVRGDPFGGRTSIPRVATVISRTGLDINVTGDFTMGPNEKLTALGDLNIVAGGVATLGDLNANGNITVTAPDIRLRLRDAGRVYDVNGDLVNDTGVDFVAAGSIDFSSVPTTIGSGGRATFATPNGDGDAELLGYSFRAFSGVANAFVGAGGPPAGQLLDLRSLGPTNTNVAEAIAGAIPDETTSSEVPDPLGLTREQKQALREMGVIAMDLDAEELLDFVIGRALYNDVPNTFNPNLQEYRVTGQRLPTDLVSEIVDLYWSIFTIEVRDSATGEVYRESQTDFVRDSLGGAWSDLVRAGRAQNAEALASFVSTDPGQGAARDALMTLSRLFELLDRIGLTEHEARGVKARILQAILPEGMTLRQLMDAVEAFSQPGVPVALAR